MNIQTTKDYKKFKIISGNRPLNRANLKQITKSIAENNMLSVSPIIVNEDFEIVDGQHRFQIAKENGYEIPYIVLKGGNLRAVHLLNNVNRRWNVEDYIKSYSSLGLPVYKRFLRFMQDTELAAQPASYMIWNRGGGTIFRLIKNGDMPEITDAILKEAHARFDIYSKILDHAEGNMAAGRKETLIQTVLTVIKNNFSDALIAELNKRNVEFKHQINVVGYLREFEQILNWNTKKTENLVRLF